MRASLKALLALACAALIGCSDALAPQALAPATDDSDTVLATTETCTNDNDVGRYKLTFFTDWTSDSFSSYPALPHFSPLIGAAHNENVKLWEPGATASDGIESMAEDGFITILSDEINLYEAAENSRSFVWTNGVAFPPATRTMNILVTGEFSRFSIVTMIAPSPDWFVGVESLELCEGPGWVESVTLDAFVYDAGTDDGTTFNAPNDDTNPRIPIAQITDAPFNEGEGGAPLRVGTFTFELQP